MISGLLLSYWNMITSIVIVMDHISWEVGCFDPTCENSSTRKQRSDRVASWRQRRRMKARNTATLKKYEPAVIVNGRNRPRNPKRSESTEEIILEAKQWSHSMKIHWFKLKTGHIQTGLVSARNSETGHSKWEQNFYPRSHENMVKRMKLR